MLEGLEFSDALFFAPEKVGKFGEENAGCHNLRFIAEKTFEMTVPRGPKGAEFNPSAMKGTLVILAGGRTRGVLYGVSESGNKPTKPNTWLGTFDRAEGLLGGPLFRWHYDNYRGNPEGAAKHVGLPVDRYVMLMNGNVAPTADEIATIATKTGLSSRELKQWANRRNR